MKNKGIGEFGMKNPRFKDILGASPDEFCRHCQWHAVIRVPGKVR
jgi:hypothetical protein